MSLKDKNYIVYVKKCFHLKDGNIKETVSRYGFKTINGAKRCLSRMKSRRDVIKAFINQE